MIRRKRTLFIFIWILIAAACSVDRDPCLLPKTTSMRLGTYRVIDSSNAVVDSFLPKPIWIAIDSNRGIQFADRSSKFSLQLSSQADSCRYAIIPDSANFSLDTITFYYERQLLFLSNSCGYTYSFLLKNIRSTRYGIDSIKFKNPIVNTDANTDEHVQIFY